MLSHKFQILKKLILETIDGTSLQFSQEEARRIADYAKGSYFKHLRLYDYVLNNKQMSEVKRIQLKRNEPKVALSLDVALLLGAELAQV